MPWNAEYVRAVEAAWEAGDAVAPLDWRLPPPALADLVRALRPTHMVRHDGVVTTLEGGLPSEPGDALVIATSGSSSSPKAAVLTHSALRASALATSERLGVDPSSDKWLACIPLSHAGGIGVVTRSLLTATPVIVHERFDPDSVRAAAVHDGATLVSVVAAALARMDPSLFRAVLLGGAAAPSSLETMGPNVVTTYGMTETGGGVVYDGTPLEGVEIRIAPVAGARLGPGEILLRAPMLMRSYRDGTDPRTEDGWFPTGDAGRIEGGRLHVDGRMSETINTGGEKVWPNAVEHAVGSHPEVAEVAVGKRADPEWGERVVAFVVPRDPGRVPSLDELRDFVSATIPRFAAPRELVVVDKLPRLASGKVARRLLPDE